jgi:hypothetical protein
MSCGCDQKTRRVLDPAATEGPVLVVADGEEDAAFACGSEECGAEVAPAIRAVRVERARKAGDAYEVTEQEVALPESFGAASQDSPGCLPWVRITHDTKRYKACLAAARRMGQMTDSSRLYAVIKDHMMAQEQECFLVIMVDTQLHVRGVSELTRGARDRVMAPIPDVLRLPLVDGAMGFAVAHNHPSGKSQPSNADTELTRALKAAADTVELLLLDHLVVGIDSYYSYRDNGLL